MSKTSLGFWFATWFGTGLSPVAPGTVATLATLPLHFALVLLPPILYLAVILAVAAAGFFAAQQLAADLREDDPQIVVIDESVGILLALWIAAPSGLLGIAVATVLFRLLDIYKPWPIRLAERLRPPGLGIMADDVAAAIVAGLITRLLLLQLGG